MLNSNRILHNVNTFPYKEKKEKKCQKNYLNLIFVDLANKNKKLTRKQL